MHTMNDIRVALSPVEQVDAPVHSTTATDVRGLRKNRIRNAIARRIRRYWHRCDVHIRQWAVRSPRRSTWYYTLFNRGFDREHQAVLAGRQAWEDSKFGSSATTSLLRRNTHRLEKGLLMRPRRSVFALDYIKETVDFYCGLVSGIPVEQLEHDDELRWASDVLDQYFKVSGAHPLVDRLRERYLSAWRPISPVPEGKSLTPYKRDLSTPPSVTYDDLLRLAIRRRSVRWFNDTPVPRDLLEKAVTVASLSPSACNRQPYSFRVFDDPKVVEQVAALPGGTRGFSHQFPAIVVLLGELRNYYGERDRHLIYIDASLAAMSFVLAAETLGLSTCCINWPDIEEDEQRAAATLQLERDQRPIMFIAVGYPDLDGLVACSQKKPNTRLIRYNYD